MLRPCFARLPQPSLISLVQAQLDLWFSGIQFAIRTTRPRSCRTAYVRRTCGAYDHGACCVLASQGFLRNHSSHLCKHGVSYSPFGIANNYFVSCSLVPSSYIKTRTVYVLFVCNSWADSEDSSPCFLRDTAGKRACLHAHLPVNATSSRRGPSYSNVNSNEVVICINYV